jgi:DNA-binding CsgD family transcriptional regulator
MKPAQPATADKQAGCIGPAPARLSAREIEIVRQIADDRSSKEIAVQLGISLKTVESHRTNLFQKLGCRCVVDLVRYAICKGLVEP